MQSVWWSFVSGAAARNGRSMEDEARTILRDAASLEAPILSIAAVMVLRGAAEHWRAVMAHETAALVQKTLRRTLYDTRARPIRRARPKPVG